LNFHHAAALLSLAAALTAGASEMTVPMKLLEHEGPGTAIGAIRISETRYGLVFTPKLERLSPGTHGFHLHENNSCEPGMKDGKQVLGLAAGGHYNPTKAKHHGAPWGDGHLGDLPVLYVAADGRASQPVLAPRLKMSDMKGRSLMIHDEHDDHAAHAGGGRMACGVVPR
jgi:Cu-Zn family superoxide dismutase